MSFIIVGNIFILKLFVGIVIDKFNHLKEKIAGYSLLTCDQKEWVIAEQLMIKMDLKKFRFYDGNHYVYAFKSSPYFNYFTSLCILCSIIV